MDRSVEALKLRTEAEKALGRMQAANAEFIEARVAYMNIVIRMDRLIEKLILDLAERASKDCTDCDL